MPNIIPSQIDSEENKIQCLECKDLFYKITPAHLKKCCGLTISQYKEKYPHIIITSKKTKQKMRISHIDKIISLKTRKKISKSLEGHEVSNETRLKIGKSLKGREISEKTRLKYSVANSGENNPMFGKKHREDSKQKIKNTKLGMKCSDKTKQKMRLSRIKEIEEKNGYVYPNFNLYACKFFDWINETFNWKGLHAENGGEYHVKKLGYFLDYYDIDSKLIIEWNEKHHYNSDGTLKEKDKKREEQIINHFNDIIFIRIEPHIFDNNIDEIKNNFIDLIEQL